MSGKQAPVGSNMCQSCKQDGRYCKCYEVASMSGAPVTLSEAIELAFYEAEKHVPAKEGYCEKCGFCHCESGHVLEMARQGVIAALRAQQEQAGEGRIERAALTDIANLLEEVDELKEELRAALAAGSESKG
jgi:hypothetical protein